VLFFSFLHAKATHATALFVGSLALHLLANLDVDFEELGDAAVQADRFALVQLGFPVIGRNAFGVARLSETREEEDIAMLACIIL
jgi:hypothetical protein